MYCSVPPTEMDAPVISVLLILSSSDTKWNQQVGIGMLPSRHKQLGDNSSKTELMGNCFIAIANLLKTAAYHQLERAKAGRASCFSSTARAQRVNAKNGN